MLLDSDQEHAARPDGQERVLDRQAQLRDVDQLPTGAQPGQPAGRTLADHVRPAGLPIQTTAPRPVQWSRARRFEKFTVGIGTEEARGVTGVENSGHRELTSEGLDAASPHYGTWSTGNIEVVFAKVRKNSP
jgi:hypothetical protein